MKDYLLFVDTETSGIPQSLNARVSDVKNWPFILQLAWSVYDWEGNLIKKENHFIFEEDIFIEESSVKIHGITREELSVKGEYRKAVMRLFASDLRFYQPLIVGHFVEFDSKMIQVAFTRCGMKNPMKKFPHFCTMKATSEYTRFDNHNYPRLEELYQRLFGEKMVRLHDAAVDVEATARCFYELYRRGELTDQLISSQTIFTKMGRTAQKTGCGLPVLCLMIAALAVYLL